MCNRATLLFCSLLAVASFTLGISTAAAKVHTAAVMPLGMGAGGDEFRGLGRSLADMMVSDFSQSKELRLVEREQLGLILAELKLSKSGYLDKRTAQKLGHGLSAEYVITGSFSVVKEQFTIVCRIFHVETGAILKSANSTGPVEDFVAVEKDVVEKLLDGLSLKLSLGAKRKMLLATPTENVRALASFGRGLEAKEEGQVKVAQRAFEEALRRDPDFAKAGLALADLSEAINKIQSDDIVRARTKREQIRAAAIAAIPSELSRPANFVDSRSTKMDFAIRQYLLGQEGKFCQRYKELKHYLFRYKGVITPWFEGLGPRYQESYQAGEPIMTKRAAALGLLRNAQAGHAARNFFTEASDGLDSGAGLLIWRSIDARYSLLLTSLAYCHNPKVEMAEFGRLHKQAKRWPWYKKSVSQTYGEKPSTITAKDSLDLYWAYLRAKSVGVDGKVGTRTNAVLARHPQGDFKRGLVVGQIQKIVDAGIHYEQDRAARLGVSKPKVVQRFVEAQKANKAALFTNEQLCAEILTQQQPHIKRAWKQYQSLRPTGASGLERIRVAVNNLGGAIAPLVMAQCYRSGNKSPLTKAKVGSVVVRALKRPHPQTRKVGRCTKYISDVVREFNAFRSGKTSVAKQEIYLLKRVYFLQMQRCLLP